MKSNAIRAARPASWFWMLALGIAIIFSIAGTTRAQAQAQASRMPDAGTEIGTAAVATFATVKGGATSQVVSAKVSTSVAAVAQPRLNDAQTKSGVPLGTVTFPFTVRNAGNDFDTFKISVADGGEFEELMAYPDRSGNGQPDVGSTGTDLSKGNTYESSRIGRDTDHTFVVVAKLKGNATGTVKFEVAAKSTLDDTKKVTTDATVTVADANAIAFDVSPVGDAKVDPDVDVKAKFKVVNKTQQEGFVSLEFKQIKDSGLSLAKDTISVNGSIIAAGTKIGGHATTIEPGADSKTATLRFWMNKAQEVAVEISATVPAAVKPGSRHGILIGYVAVDGNGKEVLGSVSADSQPFVVTIKDTAGFSFDFAVTGGGTIAEAVVGSELRYPLKVTNNGSKARAFDMEYGKPVSAKEFPAGTSFRFEHVGGAPLVDSDSNGIADTGTIEPDESVDLELVVKLPKDVRIATKDSSSIKITAKGDGGKALDATLSRIVSGDFGLSVNGQATDSSTANVDLNKRVWVEVKVENKNPASTADSYVLHATTVGNAKVTFHEKEGDDNSQGSDALTTPKMASDSARIYFAAIDTLSGDALEIKFTATSDLSGEKVDRSLSLTSSARSSFSPAEQKLTIRPAETKSTTHVLSFVGKLPDSSATLKLEIGNNSKGLNTVLSAKDASGDDIALSNGVLTLTSMAQLKGLTVSVEIVAAVDAEIIPNTLKLTLKEEGKSAPIATATIHADVVTALLALVKTQVADAVCSSSPTGHFTGARLNPVKPGECIWYRVHLENFSAVTASNVVVADFIPAGTTVNKEADAVQRKDATGTPVGDSKNVSRNNATLNVSVDELGAGHTLEFTYQVKVNGGQPNTLANP